MRETTQQKNTSTLTTESGEGLKRAIGVWGLSANIVNIMVGAGIFVLPAIVAGTLGSTGFIAYIFCGILIMLIMLCFAEIGSKITDAGGPYTYIVHTLGPYAGFLIAIFFVSSAVNADAAVAHALAGVLGSVFPVFKSFPVRVLFFIVLFSGLALVNVIGVKQGIGLVKIITVMKLTPMILLVIFGWNEVETANLTWNEFPRWDEIGSSSLILFFAFQGGESGLSVSGEVRDPTRSIPRAIFIGIFGVLLLYMLMQTVCQGVLGGALPDFREAPLAEVAGRVFGPTGFSIMLFAAAVSMFGNISGEILSLPRVLFAAARDRVVPVKGLARIHSRFATPYISIVVYAAAGLILACLGGFDQLAIISGASVLLVYLGVAIAVVKLRLQRKNTARNSNEFHIPGGALVPVLSAGIILWFLSNLTRSEKTGMLVLAGVLTFLYLLIRWSERRKR